MGWQFWRREERNAENPAVPVSARDFIEKFHGVVGMSAPGVRVTMDRALGVPSVWAAVNFLSSTLAALPLHLYERAATESKRVEASSRSRKGRMAVLLRDAANEEASSFAWRKAVFDAVFTHGRSFTFIERNGLGDIVNLWPLNPASVTVERSEGRTRYRYQDGSRRLVYSASEVVDVPFMLKPDGLGHRSPVLTNADAIGMAIAATTYSSKLFANGGVPPLVLEGPLSTPAGVKRASEDMAKAVATAAETNRAVMTLPTGHTLKPLGIDPDKQQLIDLQRFCVVQVARIYSLPPAFLQDLTHGTFSNTEQQDLQFIKHTLQRWVVQFEQELNLKLFGRADASLYVKFNLDGLQRGDFKTRMEGIARGVSNALFTPNEARSLMEMPPKTGGDVLLVQGANVPLEMAGHHLKTGGARPAPAGDSGATEGADDNGN
jgi:HK97 family phage portal protein